MLLLVSTIVSGKHNYYFVNSDNKFSSELYLIDLTANGSYISFPNYEFLNPDYITIMVDVRYINWNYERTVFDNMIINKEIQYEIAIYNMKYFSFAIKSDDSIPWKWYISNKKFEIGVITLTYDGSVARFYYNKTIIYTLDGTKQNIPLSKGWNLLYIGARDVDNDKNVDHITPIIIGSVLIYNRSLSFNEIVYNLRHMNNPIQDGLVLFLKPHPNKIIGNKIYDEFGSEGSIYNYNIIVNTNIKTTI